MLGKITKAVGGTFVVYSEGNTYKVFAPKKFRYAQSELLVGDDVFFTVTEEKRGIVDSIIPRRNRMLRPEVANVDIALLVVACEPIPDLLLIDKMIINCYHQDITPVLIVNKSDLASEEFVHNIQRNYMSILDVYTVSASTLEGIEGVRQLIADHTVCFAGQSAVGKTSLLNALVPTLNKPVGELSVKTQRGRHTTRHSQIYHVHGGYLVDTTGFSMYELPDVDKSQLMLYYPELMELAPKCRYKMCTHTVEPLEDCCVRQTYANNSSALPRYSRYLALYRELDKNHSEE